MKDLNELEFVRGEVFANVWQTDLICRIDPQSGRVLGWIDLTGLLPASDRPQPDAVLNGIAYDAAADRLFVTGKLWPRLFEIKLERQSRQVKLEVRSEKPEVRSNWKSEVFGSQLVTSHFWLLHF